MGMRATTSSPRDCMSAQERASLLASPATDVESIPVDAPAQWRRDVRNTLDIGHPSSTRRGAWDRVEKAAVVVASVLGVLGVVSLRHAATRLARVPAHSEDWGHDDREFARSARDPRR